MPPVSSSFSQAKEQRTHQGALEFSTTARIARNEGIQELRDRYAPFAPRERTHSPKPGGMVLRARKECLTDCFTTQTGCRACTSFVRYDTTEQKKGAVGGHVSQPRSARILYRDVLGRKFANGSISRGLSAENAARRYRTTCDPTRRNWREEQRENMCDVTWNRVQHGTRLVILSKVREDRLQWKCYFRVLEHDGVARKTHVEEEPSLFAERASTGRSSNGSATQKKRAFSENI